MGMREFLKKDLMTTIAKSTFVIQVGGGGALARCASGPPGPRPHPPAATSSVPPHPPPAIDTPPALSAAPPTPATRGLARWGRRSRGTCTSAAARWGAGVRVRAWRAGASRGCRWRLYVAAAGSPPMSTSPHGIGAAPLRHLTRPRPAPTPAPSPTPGGRDLRHPGRDLQRGRPGRAAPHGTRVQVRARARAAGRAVLPAPAPLPAACAPRLGALPWRVRRARSALHTRRLPPARAPPQGRQPVGLQRRHPPAQRPR